MTNITQYSAIQRKLHWVVVGLVALQYLLQVPMKQAMHHLHDGASLGAVEFLVTTLHTWGGAAVGAIMVYRLRLRLQRPVAVGAGTLGGWQKIVASRLHWAFYGLLFFMVLTGMLHYYLGVHAVARLHRWGEWLLLGLIVVHVLAALLHRFYKKDAVMSQMWGSRPPH